MALLNFCGFETGDFSEAVGSSGTASIDSTTFRTGVYALRTNPTTTATGDATIGGIGTNGIAGNFSATSVYATFYFQYATKPSSGTEILLRFVTKNIELRIDSAGVLSVWITSSTQLGSSGATALSSATWYQIDFGCNSSGDWEVKINGVTEISGTSSQTAAAIQARIGKVADMNGNTVDFYFDDVWIDDASFKGSFAVKRMAPDGDGNYTAWTGVYTAVDEVPHDSATTVITSATSGQAETCTLESAATAGITGIVHAVKACAVCNEPAGGTSAIQTRFRSGSTDDDTVSRNGNATFLMGAKNYVTDPATGAAWVLSALDSIEVGVDNAANVSIQCTFVSAMVAFTSQSSFYPPKILHHNQAVHRASRW